MVVHQLLSSNFLSCFKKLFKQLTILIVLVPIFLRGGGGNGGGRVREITPRTGVEEWFSPVLVSEI